MRKEFIASEEELIVVVEYLNTLLPKNALIFLRGDLAAGKTTLTKNILASKGISDGVTSPTFSLQQCYADTIFHYDLYRIENEEFMELGLFEEFDKEGWHFIEWGDDTLKTFLENIGYEIFTVEITSYEDKRKYRIEKS
ncbi:MAG TPA: tRNA (adenosine(37)-N6)-threonylcarbamoyltransferase complex ATPase subunit type 1 TsaE [Campylobacterales bacterium]|nr:tRNA (adenosine(37)-N6)-threonylcarbamoyltransferase complex ATPase subunit type 1 TsaE [Campylobacterales bacterium]HHS93713.1 tRNA (adenosine(37)-N6)-threonylcarbamoyltransferase complex ATPase subunit type 1 TsaE [Campylobacterales bacterium]